MGLWWSGWSKTPINTPEEDTGDNKVSSFIQRGNPGARRETRRSLRLWKARAKTFGVFALALVALAGGAVVLSASVSFSKIKNTAVKDVLALSADAGFRLDEVLVTGRGHVTPQQILSRLGLRRGMPLFAVNLADAQNGIAEMSWVKSVTVARRMPGQLVVTIIERKPSARWEYKNTMSLIDIEGNVLTQKIPAAYANLPLLSGAGADKAASALLSTLQAEPAIASRLSSAARVGKRRWDLHLTNGVVVMLPEKNVELGLSRAAKAQEKLHLTESNARAIDVRLLDRLVVDAVEQPVGNGNSGEKENI